MSEREALERALEMAEHGLSLSHSFSKAELVSGLRTLRAALAAALAREAGVRASLLFSPKEEA